jgi:SAM-dependent methyltransferase
MFCPEPARALAEMRRVLRPGGSFAVVVWHARERNPFFTTLFGSLAQVLPMPAPDPRAPGQFRLGDEDELAAVARAAGFDDFAIGTHELTMRSDSFETHFASLSDMAPPLRDAIARGNEEAIGRLRMLFAEALIPYTTNGRIAVPATALCVWGRK